MANEVSLTWSMLIRKGNLNESRSGSFRTTIAGAKGPVPGSFTAATSGTDVNFGELSQPGLCRVKNLDGINFVTYGIHDPETGRFYPLGELLPGESFPLRLSRFLNEEAGTGAGTGDLGAGTNRLRFRADTSPVDVIVEAFEA